MGPRVRQCLFLVAATVFGAFLLRGLHGLHAFGHYPGPYGDVLLGVAVHERHLLNVVTAVNFDYRAVDTLGEEFILFSAVAGVALILREQRRQERDQEQDCEEQDRGKEAGDAVPERPLSSEAVRMLAVGLTVVTLFFGLYVVLLAHLSVGGGFQGGAILSAAWVLIYLAGGDSAFRRAGPKETVEFWEAAGAGAYALLGLAGLLTGAAYLQNVLPLGKTGQIDAAGLIPIINAAVGIEVAAGFILLVGEFTEEISGSKGAS